MRFALLFYLSAQEESRSITQSLIHPLKKYCQNCYYPLPYKAKFCTHCGQKVSDGKVSMGAMLKKLWTTTFHLEGKFFRTVGQLFVPGLITAKFFEGKQNRYPHPVRLFLVAMFFFLVALNWMLKEAESRKSGGIFSFTTTAQNEQGDTVKLSSRTFFQHLEYQAVLNEFRKDYEALPAEWRTPEAQKAVDSLLKSYKFKHMASFGEGLPDSVAEELDTISINLVTRQIRIASLDVVRYDPEEIIRRYHIEGWTNKIAVRQGIKSMREPDTLVHAIIGSLTWTILALVALMAGVLALLYVRQRRYYVEHFIFLLHFHTGALLALLAAVVVVWQKILSPLWLGYVIFATGLAMYFAMRRYYGQGWFKTFVKWLIYCFMYLAGFVSLFILGAIVVFFIF